MSGKKFFKYNSFYSGYDLTPIQRISEVLRTFWLSRSNWIYRKNSKKYFKGDYLSNWIESAKVKSNSVKPIFTWIGHSTFLIQIAGLNILTDPIFSDLMFLYPRLSSPAIYLKSLPKIDIIIISHNHNDHMEKKSLLFLKKDNPIILVPLGDKSWFDKNGFTNVFEFDWWQDHIVLLNDSKKIKISFLPAIHWSGNNLSSINRSLWGSWMIECDSYKIYFAGDTAYSNHFFDIANKFDPINVVFMPIGPTHPRVFQKLAHVDAIESVQAFINLKAYNFIPMHWGTFKMGMDDFLGAIKLLKNCWNARAEKLAGKNLHILKIGQQLKFDFQDRLLIDYE